MDNKLFSWLALGILSHDTTDLLCGGKDPEESSRPVRMNGAISWLFAKDSEVKNNVKPGTLKQHPKARAHDERPPRKLARPNLPSPVARPNEPSTPISLQVARPSIHALRFLKLVHPENRPHPPC